MIAKFLVTDDWETQDRLVPVIGAVLGFSETELAAGQDQARRAHAAGHTRRQAHRVRNISLFYE